MHRSKKRTNKRLLISQFADDDYNANLRATPNKKRKATTADADDKITDWNFSPKQREQLIGLAEKDKEFRRRLQEVCIPLFKETTEVERSETNDMRMDMSESESSKSESNTLTSEMDTSETDDDQRIEVAIQSSDFQAVYEQVDDIYEDIRRDSIKADDLLAEERQVLVPQKPVDEETTDSIVASAERGFVAEDL